jgi:hypothetical protein
MDTIIDLVNRLNEAILKVNLSNKVFDVFYDQSEDIVTISLYHGVDKIDFYTTLASSGFLKKDDQIAINWL